jgi:hypothetical protein
LKPSTAGFGSSGKEKTPESTALRGSHLFGGDGGIRTLDTLLAYAPLAGEYLRPLGHISSTASILVHKSAHTLNAASKTTPESQA